jgi:hypothetical protein
MRKNAEKVFYPFVIIIFFALESGTKATMDDLQITTFLYI